MTADPQPNGTITADFAGAERAVRQRKGRAARNKGADFERQVARWLSQHGFPHAERAVRNGWRTDERVSADPFDILGTPGILWSLKCQDRGPRMESDAARYLDEVHAEAEARGLTGLLVWKRPAVSDIGEAWAYRVMPLVAGVVPSVPVRTSLRDAVDVLRAQGYGDPR